MAQSDMIDVIDGKEPATQFFILVARSRAHRA
jgi:hypothetical protein